jgi:hypothetical protein
MSNFEELFTPASISKELCKARLALAERRHKAQFFHEIDATRDSASKIDAPATWRDIPTTIFPGRRQWNKFRSKDRSRQSDPNLCTLEKAIQKLSGQNPHAHWYVELTEVVNLIATRGLSGSVLFSSPEIVKESKDRKKHTYRPLSTFFLADKIIESLTARYLRQAVDIALLDSCLAFRPKRDGRHKGLDDILKLHTDNALEGLFVAECDIMGFFDCVSHEVAIESLYLLIKDAQLLDASLKIDPKAIQIFEAYLACYSFLHTVKGVAEPKLKIGDPKGSYPWREDRLHKLHGEAANLEGIGIPQGGSLSGVIANAVLHRADKVMKKVCVEHGVTYLRYCDDIILLARTRSACAAALEAYCKAAQELKLPIHEPKLVEPYKGADQKRFWSEKSKQVYHWGNPAFGNSIPWLQFLGYQIRFDGCVRVRRSSVNKEMEKLARESGKILRMLTPENAHNIRKGKASIKHRVRMKLVSMAVGRRFLGEIDAPLPNCWASGFRWLNNKRMLRGNLKALDRQRERQINRISRRLEELDIHPPPSNNESPKVLERYGRPFSYWGQFKADCD